MMQPVQYCLRLGDFFFGPGKLRLVLPASSFVLLMRLKNLVSFLALALLVLACFLPWLRFEGRGVSFRGIDEMKMVVGTTVTKQINWGRPAYFHLFWAAFFLLFLFIKKSWTKWALLAAAAFNLAWTVRNFFLLPLCNGIDCPQKAAGLFLLPFAAVLLFIAACLDDNLSASNK